jgi:uridine phosphorylase
MRHYKESELIITNQGRIYHLDLGPDDIAENIILVGDQHRVPIVSKYFDRVDVKRQAREFVTHTGELNGKRISVVSTGIGTDNIDIVINELDAVVNIDLAKRVDKEKHTPLNLVRLGTSGALQPDIEVDSMVASAYGLGFDGVLNFYQFDQEKVLENDLSKAFMDYTNWNQRLPYPYIVKGSDLLMQKLAFDLKSGITATANGFYGPQGRQLRIPLAYPELNERIESFHHQGKRITNFEMETSALYGLGKVLGHNTLTICTIIANRVAKTFSKDYKSAVENMVKTVLERICE